MNPSTFRVGYYIGWAYGFPFKASGPPDNDGQSFAALWAFGFDDGPELLRAVVGPMRGEPSAGRRIGRCGNAGVAPRLPEVAAAPVSQASESARRSGVNGTATDEECE
jgi:hypothetical protein